MKDYDAYLFDWDGTLAQTFDVWLGIIRKTLGEYGLAATDKQIIRELLGRARHGLAEWGIPQADFAKIFAEWDKTAKAAMNAVPLYPQTGDLLEVLARRGKKVVLVTASVRPTVELALRLHGIDHHFNFLVTANDIREHKPHPEGILFALGKLRVPKGRALMLGDSEKDIRAANNAGIDSALFFPHTHHEFHAFDQLSADKPTYTLRSWRELIDELQ